MIQIALIVIFPQIIKNEAAYEKEPHEHNGSRNSRNLQRLWIFTNHQMNWEIQIK